MTLVPWSAAGELGPSRPGAAGPRSSSTPDQFSTRTDAVLVTATVFRGRSVVQGLPREAFRVFEDDISRPLTYFASEDVPLELLVAIDVSSSLRKAMGQVRENASRFVSELPPTSDVTLVSFNDEWRTLADPSTPLPARLEAIAPLAPYGMTSLYDALMHSFDVLGRQLARHGVVVFTDGEDTASHTSGERVEERSETSDAVLYMIGHGQALESVALRELCERLASKSGGRAFFPRQTGEMREAFDAILEELSSQYLLAYEPRLKTPDDRWHRIRVEVVGGEYEVRARQGYRYGR